MVTALFNSIWQIGSLEPPAPMYFFTRLRRKMTGKNITYVAYEPLTKSDHLIHGWMQETARYLNTEAVEYDHGCFNFESLQDRNKCMKNKAAELERADIKLYLVVFYDAIPRTFDHLFTSMVMSTRIAVPRDRPLNAFELMLLPFSWQVWILLLAIFSASEVAVQFFPHSFENEPVLLAVCGFERQSLHKARQREKITLQSLIVLMFFMSNAFETKIVSLMINKPSIQRIKTYEDLVNSDVRFSGLLDNNPHYTRNPVIGSMIVNGTYYFLIDKVPGFGLYLLQEQAEVLKFTAYDYTRMQPWYVILDLEYYVGPKIYQVSLRNPKLGAMRYIQMTLTEAGLTDMWTRKWQYRLRFLFNLRCVMQIKPRIGLSFDDMKLAWGLLAIGLSFSAAVLLVEIIKKKLEFLLNCFGNSVEIQVAEP